MKVLFLTWEFPPFISGGLAMACYGMVKSLLKKGVEFTLVLPTSADVYFHLVKPEDADQLTPIFIDDKTKSEFEYSLNNSNISNIEFLKLLGVSETPETYLSSSDFVEFMSIERYFEVSNEINTKNILKEIKENILSSSGLFKKVREFSIKVSKIAKLVDFDCIHAHDWLCYPAGIVAANMSGKPLICHIHATEFDRSGGTGDERIHKIEYAGLSLADRVISVSNYTANIIVNRYRVDTSKIRVVHNAFHLKTDNGEKKRIFKDPVILFLGRITLQKGPEYFLEVATRVIDTYPLVSIIMVGTGDLAKRLIQKSAEYKLLTRFLFTGFMNREEVEAILSASDIMILPSVSEPFGIAPLEAMSFGIATIISKQSGVSEVVNNVYKVNFWDVEEMSNIILDLLSNPEKMREMGQKARQEVEKIQWDKSADLILKCYKELLCST